MSQLAARLAALSQEQRDLLALRAEKKGLDLVIPQPSSTSAGSGRDSSGRDSPSPRARRSAASSRELGMSLLFFSADGGTDGQDKYRLLFESARFADRHGFEAIWTPERHFQDFGGLYPNPSVLSAALGAVTRRVQIRAGSLVLPLHNPIRVVEDWALLDNLTGGRVGISFATGWHPVDFALSPGSHRDRREITFRSIELIRRLWAGERVEVPGPDGKPVEIGVLPRPLRPELPMWITTSGSPETWRKAGELGLNVLTGLTGDPDSELAERIRFYRQARRERRHDPQAGRVTVMLHTFIGTDSEAVRETVREPVTRYLRTFIKQSRHLDHQSLGIESDRIRDRDIDDLATHVFERYFNESSLLGTPGEALRMIERLKLAEVDEVACLIDFGLDLESVLGSLDRLAAVNDEQSRHGKVVLS